MVQMISPDEYIMNLLRLNVIYCEYGKPISSQAALLRTFSLPIGNAKTV